MGATGTDGRASGLDGNAASAARHADSRGSSGVSWRAGVLPHYLSVDDGGPGHRDGPNPDAKDRLGSARVDDPDGVCRRRGAGALEYYSGSRGYEGTGAAGSVRVCDLPRAVDSDHASFAEFSGSY